MEKRTCAHCGEAPARKIYCSQKCKDAAKHRRRYVPRPREALDRDCGQCGAAHFAKGMCRRHYYQARWARGLDRPDGRVELSLHGVASLWGAARPAVKAIRCHLTVGLLVECPRCHGFMAAHSVSGRYCPNCWTTVELNPEEVSWVISERPMTTP